MPAADKQPARPGAEPAEESGFSCAACGAPVECTPERWLHCTRPGCQGFTGRTSLAELFGTPPTSR